MWWAGLGQLPTHLHSHSLKRMGDKIRWKSSWIEVKTGRLLAIYFFGGNKAKQSGKCSPANELVPRVEARLLGTNRGSHAGARCLIRGRTFLQPAKAAAASIAQRCGRAHYPMYSSGQTLSNQRGGMTSTGECGFPSCDSR